MTLAQAVLEIFCSQASIGLQCNKMKNFEKGNNSAMTNLIDKKKIRVFLTLGVLNRLFMGIETGGTLA